MARTTPRPQPTTALVLRPLAHDCARCGEPRWAAYHNDRTVTTWAPVVRLTLQRRRCAHPACPQVGQPSRPEEAGRRARPKHACGLEVIALVGTLRSAQPRSVPESHPELERRRVVIAPRTGLPLWERSDARRARSRTDTTRLQRLTAAQGQGMLALDGLPPDVGQAGLWGLRDGLAGVVRLARRLRSATHEAWATLRTAVRQSLRVPIVGVLSDGPLALRRAVAQA